MHWYSQDGQPAYEVPNKSKGGMRPTTLSDAKKLDLSPSVTTILGILDRPGLNRWLETQVLNSALTLPREPNDTDEIYMAKIRQDAKELSTLARDEGTRIHDALESVFKDRVVDQRYRSLCNKVKASVCEYFGAWDGWIAETSFSHNGYGGKVDLHNKSIHVVADFKTKEEFKTDKTDKIVNMAYDEHVMQLAAYAEGLLMPGAGLVNIFVDYDGNTIFHEWKEEEIERGWSMFNLTLELWKLQKKF